MEHTIKTFDTAYPGSMSQKANGSYVERDDAKSLAAALLEIIATEKRSASDLLDALQASRDEFHALKAQRDELLAIVQSLTLATDEGDDRAQGTHYVDKAGVIRCKGSFLALIESARTAAAKHKGAEHG